MARRHIYISIDVEADGPIPGPYSMLQFGAAAFDLSSEDPRTPIATYKANLDLLPGAVQCPDTMKWWESKGEAYANTRVDARVAGEVMPEFLKWCGSLPGKPCVIGYPVTYDFMWLYWYSMKYGGLPPGQKPPFSHSGLDIKTLASWLTGRAYRDTGKGSMPRTWFRGAPRHTHDGLDDAIGQGVLFVNMVRDEE